MATSTNVFNLLVEKRELSVKTGSKSAHDSLRTRLVKLFSAHKKLLDSMGADDGSCSLSVSAHYELDSGTSTFHIKKAEKVVGKERIDYEILGDLGSEEGAVA